MLADPNRIITLLWMIVFTIWMAAAYSSNEPIHGKSDCRSRIAVWLVGIAWLLLLSRRLGGPFAWHVIAPAETGTHSSVSKRSTNWCKLGRTLSCGIRSIPDSCSLQQGLLL